MKANPLVLVHPRFGRLLCLLLYLASTCCSGVCGAEQAATSARAEHARELLDLLGVGSNDWQAIQDGTRLSDADRGLIHRLLFQFPRIHLLDLERWAEAQPGLDTILADPSQHRADTVVLTGQARSVEAVELSLEQRQRFRFERLFRIHLQIEGQTQPVIVFCREIPKAWPLGTVQQPGGFRTEFLALFMKNAEIKGVSAPVFVAQRAAWYPQRISPELGIHAAQRVLGVLSMDVGLFDKVQHERKIVSEDRECFYQLLSAVGRLQAVNLSDVAQSDFDIVQLLGHPQTQTGLAYRLRGTARRAIRIVVDDPDIRQRFGIDHYFEIELFVDLPQHLKLVDKDVDRGETYVDYPMVFCVRSLPKGMAEGPVINQQLELSGFYFKLWTFRNERLKRMATPQDNGSTALQSAPLFIGLPPRLIVPPATSSQAMFEAYFGFAFVAVLLFVSGGVYWYSRQDKRFRQSIAGKENDRIDFSKLDGDSK